MKQAVAKSKVCSMLSECCSIDIQFLFTEYLYSARLYKDLPTDRRLIVFSTTLDQEVYITVCIIIAFLSLILMLFVVELGNATGP